jgi:hypothetical protein
VCVDESAKDKQFSITPFLWKKTRKFERGGQLNIKSRVLFYEGNLRTVVLC